MNAPFNPLSLFSRDDVINKINNGTYRRFFLVLGDGSSAQLPKEYILRYMLDVDRDTKDYALAAEHEDKIGWHLYIEPIVRFTDDEPPQVTVLEKSDGNSTV